MILPSRTALTLGGLLAASLVGNGVLFWQLAQAKPECESSIAGKVNESVVRVQRAVVGRDKTSRAVTKESDDRTTKAIAEVDDAIQIDKGEIDHAYAKDPPDPSRDIDCTVLRPVPYRVQNAIESAAARAAGR